MKKVKKHFKSAIAGTISLLILSQALCLPAYAANNSAIGETVPTTEEPCDPAKDSTFVLANSDVQISDDYIPESSYISEVENPELSSITDDPDYKLEVEPREYPEGLVLSETQGDPMVYLTQKWLNQEYGDVPGFGSVPENGKTGWDTVYGLTRALQHELGITDLANNFGPTTERLYGQNPLHRQDGVTNRQFAILQGALWCKGYSPGYYLRENPDGTVSFDEIFNESVERAVIELKEDAGLINPDGVVTVNVMKALMSMDAFKLLSSYGGDVKVREMQQKLNRKYEAYTGLTPCDGVYGRNTNKAIVYALQAEEGLPTSVANGNFGVTTKKCCPRIPYARNSSAAKNYSGGYYTQSHISAMTELVQFALYVNGYGDGVTDGIFDEGTRQAIRAFQKEYAIPVTGVADKTTWLSLFISCGDTDRSAKAADCATQLSAAQAKSLYNNGYRYIGRYLTGTYNGGKDKAIYRDEAERIFAAGLNFFPIYQTSARSDTYFTPAKGTEDAYAAIEAAAKLGVPKNTIIYFAVDFDCMDYQITSNIIPYFKAVHDVMSSSIYQTGIYGTRNCCTRVSEMGYACSSFVGDMSTGFSGNLGYSMPDNWAFDQFYTTSIGSGAGYLEIDKDGFSGRDTGVSWLNAPQETPLPNITVGESFSDKLVGPLLNILGYETPAFELPFGFSIDLSNLISYEDDWKEGTRKVTIGINEISKDNYDPYEHIKELIESFEKSPSTASWNSLKGIINNVKKFDFKIGFNMSGSILGFVKYDLKTGAIKDSGLLIIADASVSARTPVYPLLFLKFEVAGNITGTNIKFVLTDAGGIGVDGSLDFSVRLKAGLEADVFIANAYAGASGGLNCEIGSIENVKNDFKVYANFTLFVEAGILFWGGSLEWEFANLPLYTSAAQKQSPIYSLTKDDLKFIEPVNRVTTFSNEPDVFLPNVQTYCSPQIISLGDNKMIMLYIDDAASRSAENRTTLMYSIFDGAQWSPSLPVYDDGTVDFTPEIYPDGNGGAHIVWQNAKTVFDSDVTLDEMTPNMELHYAHWNGNSMENITSLTSNGSYESKHMIASNGNDITVVWQENSENDPFGLTGTNQIYRKQFKNGSWQESEIIASGLNPINSIATSYVGANNVVAYTAKTNSATSSMDDLEVFYFDGSTSRITNDTIPDYSVTFLDEELYWISNNTVVSVTGGDVTTKTTAIAQIPDSVSNIKALKNTNGQKAIVWSQDDDVNTKIYGTYYNESTKNFGAATPLTEGDGVIRGWNATMMPDGQIQLSYCAAEMLDEPVNNKPYGQLNLIQKGADEFFDISVSEAVAYDGEVVPNGEIMLSADVYNNGSENVTQFDAAVIAPDGTVVQNSTIDSNVSVGENKTFEVPFALPAEITKTDYQLKITPHDGEDIFLDDNQSAFTVGYADLAIHEVKEERTDTGRRLVVTILNQGYEPADGVFKVIDGSISQEVFSNNNISQLEPGKTVEFIYEIEESRLDSSISEDPLIIGLEIESEEEEPDYINNSQTVYVYPDYSINLTAGTGGTVSGAGNYIYNSTVTLTAIPDPGYIFAGWYENGKPIGVLSEEYSVTVMSNRTLEAKFIPNNLSITDIEIFGTLEPDNSLTFTAIADGGKQPYQWEFYIYKDNDVCYSDSETSLDFFEWTPSEAGTYRVVANVTDASGFKATYAKEFTIT